MDIRDELSTDRRTVLKSIGVGAIVSSPIVSRVVGHTEEGHSLQLRPESNPLSFKQIENTRRRYLQRRSDGSANETSAGTQILAYPQSYKNNIFAYNLDIVNGTVREYFGYSRPSEVNKTERVKRVHHKADEYLNQCRCLTAQSSNFSDWEHHYEVTEEIIETDGEVLLENDIYRYNSPTPASGEDQYAITSWGEMFAGGHSSVSDSIKNSGFELEHDWASNADMEGKRQPETDIQGQSSTNWSLTIGVPSGVSTTIGGTYTQSEQNTYEEGNPTHDFGRWTVDVTGSHTEDYSAYINPTSTAEIDRSNCINPPSSPPVQPVATVSLDAIFIHSSTYIPIEKQIVTGISDSAYHCQL